jgi:hypothetical protein
VVLDTKPRDRKRGVIDVRYGKNAKSYTIRLQDLCQVGQVWHEYLFDSERILARFLIDYDFKGLIGWHQMFNDFNHPRIVNKINCLNLLQSMFQQI